MSSPRLEVGQPAPAFTLPDADEKPTSLADLLAEHRDKLQHAITLFQVRLYSSSTLQILINVSDTGDRPNGHPYGWGHGRIDNTPGQHLRLGWVRGVHTRFPSIRLAHIYM